MQQSPKNRGTYNVFTIYYDVFTIYYDNFMTCDNISRYFTGFYNRQMGLPLPTGGGWWASMGVTSKCTMRHGGALAQEALLHSVQTSPSTQPPESNDTRSVLLSSGSQVLRGTAGVLEGPTFWLR